MSSRARWRGWLAISLTVVIWSTPPLFQYYLAATFDPWTQNFYRYACAFLTVAPFVLWGWGRRSLRLTRREWVGCLAVAVPNVVHQVAQTAAVVIIMPGVYALIGRFSVVLTAVMAVILFADERWIARSRSFQAGLLVGLAGVAGIVAWGGPVEAGMLDPFGVGLALAATVGWAAYGVMVKQYTVRIGPTVGFGVISFFTSLLLLPLSFALGDPSALWRAAAETNAILVASAVVCIALGHWLYYVAIRDLGAASSQAVLLLCPLGTVLLSGAFFGEPFAPGVLVPGALLLAGALLTIVARPTAPLEDD